MGGPDWGEGLAAVDPHPVLRRRPMCPHTLRRVAMLALDHDVGEDAGHDRALDTFAARLVRMADDLQANAD